MLDEIAESRKEKGDLVYQKQSIVCQLIANEHKKECK